MYVQFGNTAPTALDTAGQPLGPCVTTIGPLPDDGEYGYTPHPDAETLATNLARHIASTPAGASRVGDISDGTGHHEAFLAVLAGIAAESNAKPAWVWSDDEDFAVLLGHFYDCPVQEREEAP